MAPQPSRADALDGRWGITILRDCALTLDWRASSDLFEMNGSFSFLFWRGVRGRLSSQLAH